MVPPDGTAGDHTRDIANLSGRCGEAMASGRIWPRTISGSGGSGEAVTTRAEVAGDQPVGGERALGVARTLEPAHSPLPLAGWLVRILRPVVQPFVLLVLDAGQRPPLRRPITRELVGDDDALHIREILEQSTEEFLGRSLVPTALYQDVEHMPS